MAVAEAVAVRDISQLPDIVNGLSGANRTLLEEMVEITSCVSEVGEENLPDPALQEQTLIETYNPWTHQRAVYNPYRARRPQQIGNLADLEADIASTFMNNIFCLFKEKTPPNKFGRIEGRHHVTSGNPYPSAQNHGNLIAFEHSPLVIPTKDQFSDRYEVALQWREAAYAASKGEGIYPSIIENRLKKSGGTIDHSHSQLALRSGRHEGEMEEYWAISNWHGHQTGRNYFDDLFRAHQLVGLGVEVDGLRAFPSLTPLKEAEIMVLADRFDSHSRHLIFRIYEGYMRILGMRAFNFTMVFAPIGYDGRDWGRIPAMVGKFISRGDPTAKSADIAGFELLKTSIISSNPFQVNEMLKEVLVA